MARTVEGAFTQFRQTIVDLDPNQVAIARASRDWLYGQMQNLVDIHASMPPLGDYRHWFGSFNRRTKIRELDDIDMMITLDGTDCVSQDSLFAAYTVNVAAADTAPLAGFRDQNGYVNSIRILNGIKTALITVPQYNKAEFHRRGEAVTLKLSSYPWTFDIVPAIEVWNSTRTGQHFLIPDGNGAWKKTDPRLDAAYTTRINTMHNNVALPTIRLLKYWKEHNLPGEIGSYYFETLALKTFELQISSLTTIRQAVSVFFYYVGSWLLSTCPDPKGLEPALDRDISSTIKWQANNKIQAAATIIRSAMSNEARGYQQPAIGYWRQVFGSEFPSYG